MRVDIRIDGTDVNNSLDAGELPEKLATAIEEALTRMQETPGMENETINLVLVNDFEEPEDEEEESDEEETETEKPSGT